MDVVTLTHKSKVSHIKQQQTGNSSTILRQKNLLLTLKYHTIKKTRKNYFFMYFFAPNVPILFISRMTYG